MAVGGGLEGSPALTGAVPARTPVALPLSEALCYRRTPIATTSKAADPGSNRRAEVAQLVEHRPEEAGVVSSILTLGTTFAARIGHGRKWLSW